MSLAASLDPPSTGGLWLVPAPQKSDACKELAARRFLVAPVATQGARRGQLRAAIDDAVEGALALRGALPPCLEVDADPSALLRDQLFRLRATGAGGLAVALPRLSELADPRGWLDAGDGAALSTWMEAARGGGAPVVLLADDTDGSVRFLAPRALGDVASVTMPLPVIPELDLGPDELHTDEEPPLTPVPPAVLAAPVPETRIVDTYDDPAEEPDEDHVAPAPRRAARIVDAASWRQFAVDLDGARGPKPVSVIERLFTTRYMPLLGAQARGEVDGAVGGVIDAWRASFEHSYRDSFAALRVTGRRPPMVLDAPDIAARLARQNGARNVKLVLVDAMRFDIGERVAMRVDEALVGRAVAIERSLLWSALPTTTPTQLALIARGVDGLREPPTSEREPDVARGRSLGVLRRERLGAREVMKLDVVEARMRAQGAPYEDRLDAIADEVAPIVARYAESAGPRTLVYVFGDHGFRLDAIAGGFQTSGATQGGASPEEVLVPGFAWLVGGVH